MHHVRSCEGIGSDHMPLDEPLDGRLSCVVESEAPPQHVLGDPEDLTEIAIRQEFKRL